MLLFDLETDRLRLTWSGPEALPDATAPPGRVTARTLRPGGEVRLTSGGRTPRGDACSLPLRLAEETPYRLLLQSLQGDPVALRSPDPALLGGLVEADGRAVWFGDVSFRGEVGLSRFVLDVAGEAEAVLEVEVFPTKVSFADVERMRDEVDAALAGLSLDYLGGTSTPGVMRAEPSARATWLTLLRGALPDLEVALAEVARRPHQDLVREPRYLRAEQVRRPDALVRRTIRQGGGRGEPFLSEEAVSLRSVLPSTQARASLDTPEHRWLRARLEAARQALATLRQAESALRDTPRRQQVRAQLADAEARVARLLKLAPLRVASPGSPPPPTRRLLTASGYAEAYVALQTLRLGVTLAEGPIPHATKQLPLLYEVWSYFAVLEALAGVLGQAIPPGVYFRGEHIGVRLLLRRGNTHAVRFREGSRQIRLVYNPRLKARSGLLAQRPDLLLSIEDSGMPPRWFVLDAKYRRDDAPSYLRRYGSAGPPEDALGDLHRYRDAIVQGHPPRRPVESAAALFPHRPGPGYGESRLWQSLGTLGVGAVPLLPGETGWLTRWLEDVLAG